MPNCTVRDFFPAEIPRVPECDEKDWIDYGGSQALLFFVIVETLLLVVLLVGYLIHQRNTQVTRAKTLSFRSNASADALGNPYRSVSVASEPSEWPFFLASFRRFSSRSTAVPEKPKKSETHPAQDKDGHLTTAPAASHGDNERTTS